MEKTENRLIAHGSVAPSYFYLFVFVTIFSLKIKIALN